MIQMAKDYYNRLFEANKDSSLGSTQEDIRWANRYLYPKPIDKDTAYIYTYVTTI